jgi:hypothetical protein
MAELPDSPVSPSGSQKRRRKGGQGSDIGEETKRFKLYDEGSRSWSMCGAGSHPKGACIESIHNRFRRAGNTTIITIIIMIIMIITIIIIILIIIIIIITTKPTYLIIYRFVASGRDVGKCCRVVGIPALPFRTSWPTATKCAKHRESEP